MRIINHLVFLGALAGGAVFAAINWDWLWTFTPVDLYFIAGQIPLNLILLLGCLGIIFLQWLAVQGAWVLRNKKLERAEKEIVLLKARIYDLTDGSLLDDIKASIKATRQELREDIRWLASQTRQNASAQLGEGSLPPLLEDGE